MNLAAYLIQAAKGRGFQKSTTKSVIFVLSKITLVKTVSFLPVFHETFCLWKTGLRNRFDSV